ncbi:MAG: DegV family protein [Ruminococcaceae bacterium]|nr:DegV family protein [Oscillospiraceae bacterium]
MKKFAIIADSTCDLVKDLRDSYDIDYVPMNYVIDDTEYPASLDWENHSAKELYDLLRQGKHITTTQVPINAYTEKFTYYLEQGMDVLYISCSSALSGSVNLARVVVKELAEKYPDGKVVCVDSLISSLGQGWLCLCASKMRSEGKSIEEIAEYLENNKLKVNQFGAVADLKYLKRAGRVTASSAFFGNLFGVKPIIISDTKGQNFAVEKVKGLNNAKNRVAQLVADAASENGMDWLYITHSDCIEDAEDLRDRILALRPFKEIVISYIGPIVGSSVGPGTVAAYCFGKEVTVEGSDK